MGKGFAKLCSPWMWVAFVLAAFGVWGLIFYWVAQPSSAEQMDMWIGFPTGLKTEVRNDISDMAAEYGIKRVNFGTYNPTDSMYSQAFAVKAQYTDVFILTQAEAKSVAETGMLFAVLDGRTEGIADPDGKIVAVRMVGDMYVAINDGSKKDKKLLLSVVDYLVNLV